jgi:8-amino-7-oxononanoate synthase
MLFARFAESLAAIARENKTRSLDVNQAPQGVEIEIDNRRLLNFCSNDYLGLANHPVLIEALQEGAHRYGVGSGAAALLSGYSEAHQELAEGLARVTKRERALIFSSGYMANLGVMSGLVARDEKVISDQLNHASLIDGVRLSKAENVRYAHGNMLQLEAALITATPAPTWVVTDGLFSMDGDLAQLPTIAVLAKRHEAILVCDDAHGFGVLGGGAGTVTHFNLQETDVPLLVVTFGKALGTVGAAVLGPAVLIESLLQNARTFIYDTAPSPAMSYATSRALRLVTEDASFRERLFSNIRYFHAALRATGIPVPSGEGPIQILLIGEEATALKVAAGLRAKGLYVRAIRPPTVPKGTARLRICISAAHERQHLDRLVEGLGGYRDLFRPLV